MYDTFLGTFLVFTFLVWSVRFAIQHYRCDDVTVSLPRLNDKTVAKYFFRSLTIIIVVGSLGFTHTAAGLFLLTFHALVAKATVFDDQPLFAPQQVAE